MLDVDPKKRPTASELCKHPWFANMDSLPNTKLSNIQDHNLVRVSENACETKMKIWFSSSTILMRHSMRLMLIRIKT